MTTHHKPDVLIIGGGVIGLTAAYFLLHQGRSVALVEGSTVGSGSSHANCGLVTPSHIAPLTTPGAYWNAWSSIINPRSPLFVKPTLNLSRVGWFLRALQKCNQTDTLHAMRARAALLGSSRKLFSELIQENSMDCAWEESGLLVAYKDNRVLEKEAAGDELLRRYGVQVSLLGANELQEREPAFRDDVVGARFFPRDAHLKPDLLVSELLRVNRGLGLEVIENEPVQRFQLEAGRVTAAATSQRRLQAGSFVLATGAWTPQLAGSARLRIPIQPGKGYTITSDRPKNCPRIPALLAERSIAVTPWAQGFRLGGTMEFSGYNQELNSTRIQAILDGAQEYLRDPLGSGPVDYWTGWRPMSFDELPFIGRAPEAANLTVAAGHGMLGVSMGPGTGRLVSEIVAGLKPHIDAKPFRLERV